MIITMTNFNNQNNKTPSTNSRTGIFASTNKYEILVQTQTPTHWPKMNQLNAMTCVNVGHQTPFPSEMSVLQS